jgi:hypothetical protein
MTNQDQPKLNSKKPRVSRAVKVLKARAYDTQGREVARFYKPGGVEMLHDLDELGTDLTLVFEPNTSV